MKRRAFACLCAAFAASLVAQEARAPERPRLVVLCVVDQLAEWVFAGADPFFAPDGGFRRLERDGVTFAQCAYEHACSETGPGHATIGTGAPASRHGIVKNTWWSPADKKVVYCVAEPAAALPDLPDGKDRGPGRLCVPTFGDGLKAHVPGSKVASVSWKDRAAILMAGGSADAVAWIEKTRGMLVTNTTWCNATPVWIATFNQERVLDQWFGTIWQRYGAEAAYAGLVDDRPYEWPHLNGSRSHTLPQGITGGKELPEAAYFEQLYASPFGNTAVRQIAEAALAGMQLGADDVPDLLCVSFSSTDVVGHYFGPDSVEARDALLRLDAELALLMQALDRAAGAGRWAMFVTADHGVGPTPEQAKANGVAAGRGPIDTWVKAAVEKALREAHGALKDDQHYIAHVGEGAIYFDDDALAAAGQAGSRHTLARTAAAAAAKVRGIMTAYATVDLRPDTVFDDPIKNALLHAIHPERAGDVQLVMKPYWLEGATPASHGTPHPYDREVAAFALGPGLPAGARIATPISPGFGVVWFAHLLGIPKPTGAREVVPAELIGR